MYIQWTVYISNIPSQQVCLCQGWEHLFTKMHMYRTMYILGLRSFWGTSWVRSSWSPSGHILTPALSQFLGACVRSHACPEEVVYSLIDSCSYFTSFPSKHSLPMYSEQLILIHNSSTHTYLYITFIRTFKSLHYIIQHTHVQFAPSFVLLSVAGWLLSTLCVWYNYLLYEEKGTFLSYIDWTSPDRNAWHIWAHVSDLLSHVSEHASTWFGLEGGRVGSLGHSPFYSSSMAHMCTWHLYGNGQRHRLAIYILFHSWALTD
jgi:hypothetical protein